MRVHQQTFTVDTKFKTDDERVLNVKAALNKACGNTKIIIRLDFNEGGDVASAERLIRAIEASNALKVNLIFTGFAISAAAYVYAYFTFYAPKDHVVTTINSKRFVLVYHKPRAERYDVLIFANSITSSNVVEASKKYILAITPDFDDVFHAMIELLRTLNFNIAPHMEAIYNINGDVHIILEKKGV